MRSLLRVFVALACLGGALGVPGCIGLDGIFASELLSALGGGSSVADIPGDAPAILVTLQNNTGRTIRAALSYRVEDLGVETVTYDIEPGEKTAQALICPIPEITLGNVSDSSATGAVVLLNEGSSDAEFDAPYIEVEPFGVIMREGVNYDCGDAITFSVVTSSATRSGYQIFAFIERAGGGG